jgi:hypothetical protein
VWGYLLSWLLVGALRKWAFPALASPLGFLQELFVGAAYLLAFRARIFPRSLLIWAAGLICIGVCLLGVVGTELPPGVVAAGVWAYFWPIPFIYIIARVMRGADCLCVARFLMAFSMPMALLMTVQFKSSPGSFINAFVGADAVPQRLIHEGWRVRPSGTFSYVGGASWFWMAVFAVELAGVLKRGLVGWRLLAAAAAAAVLATAVCHSRTQIYGMVVVVLLVSPIAVRFASSGFGRVALALAAGSVLVGAASLVGVVQSGAETLAARFESASKSETLEGRLLYQALPKGEAVENMPAGGYGLGVGTNTGALLLVGHRRFLLAEGEWPDVILQMGWGFGFLYLGVRFALGLAMCRVWFRALKLGDPLAVAWFAAGVVAVVAGQWETPSVQGCAILMAGLCLAHGAVLEEGLRIGPPTWARRVV